MPNHSWIFLALLHSGMIQCCGDLCHVDTSQVVFENPAHNSCLLLIYHDLSVTYPIPIRNRRWQIRSVPHSPLIAPTHISRDGFAFSLREGGKQRGHHFAGHGGGVDILLFKANTDTQILQFPDDLQTFLGIPCKSGDGLYQYPIDQTSAAVRQEPLKILPLFCRCTCDAFIS